MTKPEVFTSSHHAIERSRWLGTQSHYMHALAQDAITRTRELLQNMERQTSGTRDRDE